jgi:N-acetylneuraminic acid mutarotase
MNQASEVVGRKIVVHGGWNGDETFDDMWIFNTDSFGWMQPRTAGFAPSGRFGHTMNLLADGRLVLFGGCSLKDETGIPTYNSDVRVLDTDSMLWARPRTNGDIPTGRYGHIAVLRPDQKIVIMGGWGTGGCQSSSMLTNPKVHDIQVLDTQDDMTWTVVERASKKEVRPLYNHSACLDTSGDKLYVFGGFDGRQASFDIYYLDLHIEQ